MSLGGVYQITEDAIIFCVLISLSGPILGREALGWFVDMSAIGASMGFMFTCLSAIKRMRADGDGSRFKMVMAVIGAAFSVVFMILQLIPIPGLSGVNFGKESYIMLAVWVVLGICFYLFKRRSITASSGRPESDDE